MTSAHPTGHGASHTDAGPFSAAEVQQFQAADRNAATAIIGLMTSIFLMGVVGYLLVCFWVA